LTEPQIKKLVSANLYCLNKYMSILHSLPTTLGLRFY